MFDNVFNLSQLPSNLIGLSIPTNVKICEVIYNQGSGLCRGDGDRKPKTFGYLKFIWGGCEGNRAFAPLPACNILTRIGITAHHLCLKAGVEVIG